MAPSETHSSPDGTPVRIIVQNAEVTSAEDAGFLDAVARWMRAAAASWRLSLPLAAAAAGAALWISARPPTSSDFQLMLVTEDWRSWGNGEVAIGNSSINSVDVVAWVTAQPSSRPDVTVTAESPARDSRVLRFRISVPATGSPDEAAKLAEAEANRVEGLVREAITDPEVRSRLEAALESYRRDLETLRAEASTPRAGTVIDLAAIKELELQLRDRITVASRVLNGRPSVLRNLGPITRQSSAIRLAATVLAAAAAGAVLGATADALRKRLARS